MNFGGEDPAKILSMKYSARMADGFRLGLVTQTLFVAVSPHALLAFMLVDLRFPSLL